MGVLKVCGCGNKFLLPPSRASRIKSCSLLCRDKYKIPLTAEKNPRWAGDSVGKCGVHDWIKKEQGEAKTHTCSKEDKTCKGRMEWSNVSQKYLRRLEDWQVLCASHHSRYDKHTHLNGLKTRFIKGQKAWNKKI